MLWKWKIIFWRWEWSFYNRIAKARTEFHYGIGNRCGDGRYVLFLDYDKTPLEWIDEEIELLQNKFSELGSAFRFQTKHGVHVMFLSKFSLGQIVRMMQFTSCDRSYIDVPLSYGRKIWILRQSEKKGEKIKYLGKLFAPTSRECSFPHMKYLVDVMGVSDVPKNLVLDTESFLTLGYYRIRKE